MTRYHIISALALLMSCACQAQGQAVHNSQVLKAMNDEVRRGMTQLKLRDYEKAFYMFCRVEQRRHYYAKASFGALVTSNQTSELSLGNFRILCGSYDFNDESLNHPPQREQRGPSISMPEDTSDYAGIRRSLWSTMEAVYVGAAKGFAKNKEIVNQKGMKIEQIPHRSFGQIPPTTIIKSFEPAPIEGEKWEASLKKWSDTLAHIPGILSSSINLAYTNGYTYMSSSEGMVGKLPIMKADLSIVATCKNADGIEVPEHITLFSATPETLTDEKILTTQLTLLKRDIGLITKSKSFDETYSGPVLFIGEAAAQALLAAMFDAEDPLSYRNEIEDDNNDNYPFGGRAKKRDSKFGAPVTHAAISIKVDPSRRKYGSTELLGGYELDDEGTVPVPLTLIEGGVLKALMNDRTITSATQPVNGYSRSLGGVVEVTVNNGVPESTLKKRLLEEVKKNGNEFGMIVRQLPGGSTTLYKVFPDGREEVVSPGVSSAFSLKSLRKLLAASDQSAAYNLLPFNSSFGMMNMYRMNMPFINVNGGAMGFSDLITSLIVPTALLVGDVDLEPSFQRNASKEFVSRPD